jgi:hypothetical protein
MLENESGNTAIWIAFIGSAAAILGALRADKWPGYIASWFRSRHTAKQLYYRKKEEEFKRLSQKVEDLEKELDRERALSIQIKTTLRIIVPIMRRMAKDDPDFIDLLDNLDRVISPDSNQ